MFADANPLLGSWRLSSGDPAGCNASFTFAPNSQTIVMGTAAHGWSHTNAVTYNVSRGHVYVIGNATQATGFDVHDANHIVLSSSYGGCAYTRR